MKMNKRKVFVTAVIICLVAILSFGTLAWFTDSDTITNKFMTATSDDTTVDEVFNVNLKETVEDGKEIDTEGEYTYEGVLPGDVLQKEPVVQNTGIYDQYIRVKVTVSDANAWTALAARDGFQLEDLFGYPEDFDLLWDREMADTTVANDELTVVYYLKGVLKAGEEVPFFTQVKIPGSLTKEDMVDLLGADGFSFKIVAEAIQSENTGSTAQEAFTKF